MEQKRESAFWAGMMNLAERSVGPAGGHFRRAEYWLRGRRDHERWTVRDPLLASVGSLAGTLGLDPARFEVDEDGASGVLSAENALGGDGSSLHGAYLLLALTGPDL
ncbi:hypothetical protein [Streptomyces sp. ME01-18a]|uniref:hypothetical protein n=1 Tax=Streptomyces sp. ME01-18a TaxID=3028669 RepID=UPI0029C0EE98|nr:hypothetical protein [Streptomyces sp. ME01-18a]